MSHNIEEFLGQTNGPEEDPASTVYHSLLEAIETNGYENLLNAVRNHTDDAIFTELHDLLGTAEVNVIPSTGHGVCCPVLIAFSKGLRTIPHGRDEIRIKGILDTLQQVKTHLIRCSPDPDGNLPNQCSTRTVFIFMDSWDGRSFTLNHRDEFLAHQEKGVKCFFLQIGANNHSLNWIERELAI